MIIALQTLLFFRESLLTLCQRLLSPYYRTLSLVFSGPEDEEVEEDEDQVFSDFDDERGVIFFPPVYAQRYAAVSDCLMDERWAGKLEKVVDLGYHDMSFIKYLKEVPGVCCIYGVDIETIPLRCSSELLSCEDYAPKRDSPLHVCLFQGNAADPDYRLIGCDAVIAIEMIEHMLPHDLERLIHNVFGFVQPWIAIFTTPNADFNTLFKNMEKNGLRRMDHLFEWTREQFHDWCSNIVSRYPTYTVHCKGIGPGPPGTQHLGCCSQMALFINEDYHKQPNLDLNSLALVAKVPSPCNVQDMIGWDSPQMRSVTETGLIDNVESLNEFICSEQSRITVFLTQSHSIEVLEYRDSTSQCNLDCEYGKDFLMFDDEHSSRVVVPRRSRHERVYVMQDVFSRLNCTTYQVKKFSKTTQDLMAKNKVDSLVHTREVVDEIRYLTKMLNFPKINVTETEDNGHIWCNINWGDNAPFWNQYYSVVREYHYPFETKPEECRILDLVAEEMNRLIDSQYDEEFSTNVNKFEIPIAHLMNVVRHITTDVHKFKDLLEWNGYEVVNDSVVHSRLVVETPSVQSREDEWIENENVSDWDTEFRSTSDGSNAVPDYHGRFLRRALDRKVRKLRSMLCVDQDITNELDRVICRLMKLALRTSKGKQQPPPTRWMQCKLLDLLTLTEKAIARRKKYSTEEYFPLKAIDFVPGSNFMAMLEENLAPSSIECRYREFCYSPEMSNVIMESEPPEDVFEGYSHNDLLTEHDFNLDHKAVVDRYSEDENRSGRMTSSERSFYNSTIIRSPDFKPNTNERKKNKNQKSNEKPKHDINGGDNDAKSIKSVSNVIEEQTNNNIQEEYEVIDKAHEIIRETNMELKKTSSKSCKIRNKKKDVATEERPKNKRKKKLHATASKPIPGSIIELCHPDLHSISTVPQAKFLAENITQSSNEQDSNIAVTKESLLISIVSDDTEETIALRRTIGTDADEEQTVLEQETLLNSIVTDYNDFTINTGNLESQSIFLYDINEPSTSKGVRHTSLDVQCGPDASSPAYVMLSPASSVTKMPTHETGIKLGDSTSNVCAVRSSLGGSTNTENCEPVCSKNKPISLFQKGIKIGDSDTDITRNAELDNFYYNSAAIEEYEHGTVFIVSKFHKTGIMIKDTSSSESPIIDNIEKNENNHLVYNKVEPDYTKISTPPKTLNEDNGQNAKNFIFVDTGLNSTDVKSSDRHNNSAEELVENEGSEDGSSYKRFRRSESSDPSLRIRTRIKQGFKGSNDNIVSQSPSRNSTRVAAEIEHRSQSPCLTTINSIVETELLKPIPSGLEADDSGTDFCPSFTTTLSPFRFSVDNEGKQLPKKYVRPRLSCGGIHTHSYRDNQEIEDVMYQGKWQENIDSKSHKNTLRRKPSPSVTKKSVNESLRTQIEKPKENVLLKNKVQREPQRQALVRYPRLKKSKQNLIKPQAAPNNGTNLPFKIEPKRKPFIRYPQYKKSKQNLIKSQAGSNNETNVPMKRESQRKFSIKYPRLKRSKQDLIKSQAGSNNAINVPKATSKPNELSKRLSSKTTISSLTKIRKTKTDTKKSSLKLSTWVPPGPTPVKVYVVTKKSSEKIKTRQTKKSYIPLYLKRQKMINEKMKLNNSFNSTAKIIKSKCSLIKEKPSDTNYDIENTARDVNTTVAKDSLKNVEENLEKEYVKKIFNIPDEVEDTKKKFSKFSTPTIIRTNKYVKNALIDIQKDANNILPGKDVMKDLFNFHEPRDISYCVFCNELEHNAKSSKNCNADKPRENKRIMVNRRKSSSPISRNSSCSSPDSVATVKMVHPRTAMRYSTSSNKSSLANSESEPTTPAKTRRYTKRVKNKKNEDKDKENVPETSKTCAADKETFKNDISAFTGRKKNVYMAMATETPTVNSLSKHQSQATPKSSLKIPCSQEKKRTKPVPPTVSKKKSLKSNDSSYNEQVQNQDSSSSEISNMVLLIDSRHQEYLCDETVLQSTDCMKLALSASFKDIVVGESSSLSNKSAANSIDSIMRHMIEERMVFINCSSCEIKLPTGEAEALTPTVVSETLHDSLVFQENDEWSYTSAMAQESFCRWQNNNPASDPDMQSFKSNTSTSKYSEYYLADNEFEFTVQPEHNIADAIAAELDTQRSSSVRDIFERKELPMAPNPASGLAAQVFSGFSMNAEPVSGDQPDYVNLVDSETGSLAADYHTRQAASEELFVSGRSSESYESCLIDEDAVVPDWLFEIIQQQQQLADAADSMNEPAEFIGPMPMAEANFDMNNNVSIEPGVGVGAGAGDGHGIHSDHSQDSSGRGTSLSSSGTSSGQTSDVLPMDPSAFAQYELLRESIGSSNGAPTFMTPGEPPAVSFRNPEVSGPNESEVLSSSRHEARRTHHNLLQSSDADADVSSLDTDVPDSS